MAYFIARRQVQDVITTKSGATTIIRHRPWKRDELKAVLLENPSVIFEVTESHANNVLRPQAHYQEVFAETLAELKAEIEAEAKPKQSRRRSKAAPEEEGNV